MKLHRLIGMIAVAVPLGALAAVALVVPLAAQHGRNGQLHIVKDCGAGIGGSRLRLLHDREFESAGASRGNADLLRPNSAWALLQALAILTTISSSSSARASGQSAGVQGPTTSTLRGTGGLCTLSDGVGPLAGFTARINVTSVQQAGSAVCLGWNVQLRSPAGKISRGSRNRDPVKIPLRGAAIERVYIGGRAERNEPALDSTPAGHAGDFFVGAKSVRRNMGQSLASRQRKIESIGRAHSTTTTLPQLPN